MHGMIRLRQVVVAARDLDRTVDRMCTELGLTVCFRDPGVAEFGLHNALMTVGDQFIEVVSPLADGTAAGRLLDRRHAEVTAYMVMFEVDDLDTRMAALSAAGVRNVWSGDLPSIRGRHLHPADLGGAIVSIDQPDPLGSWHWAPAIGICARFARFAAHRPRHAAGTTARDDPSRRLDLLPRRGGVYELDPRADGQ